MTFLDAKLVLAGLLVGGLVGLTGMGGGSLMTPILIFLGIPPVKAVGTDLAYAAVTKTFGAWRHHALANVNYAVARWLALGSVPASVAGVLTLARLRGVMGPDVNGLVRDVLGVALIGVGLAFALKTWIRFAPVEIELGSRLSRRQKVAAVTIGAFFGYALGLTSVGSGTFFGLALMLFFRLRGPRIVGTDVFHAAMLVVAAAAAQAATGNVQFGTVGWILVGSLPGILAGAQLTRRAPERGLRLALGCTLTAAGAALLA